MFLPAPAWIAATRPSACGSPSVFQLAKGNPKFPEQLLMGGFTAAG